MKNQNIKPLAVAIAAVLSASSMTAFAQEEPENPVSEPVIENPDVLMEEVIVRGVRAADLNARNAERQKDIFSSVISQDDVGNFADQNVAEALQRLPGVTLQKNDGQGEFVNVRGLGPSFVGVTMNNSEMASASSSGRAVGLNTIPADLMGSIEVFKSLTPDLDLNSIGGKVNVNSVTAFDRGRDSLKMTLQTTMQDQRGEAYPKGSIIGTKLLADETFGIAASLSYEERATDINQIESDDTLEYIRRTQPFFGDSAPSGVSGTAAISSTQYMDNYYAGSSTDADPYIDSGRMLIPTEFEVSQDDSVRTRIGATIDLGWRPNENAEYYLRYSHTDYTDEELHLSENYRFISGNDHQHIAVVDLDENFFAVGGTDLRHRIRIQEFKDVTTSISLGGEQIVDDWTFDFEFNRSESERENPNDRRAQFRSRDLPMYGQLFVDDIRAAVIDDSQISVLAIDAGADPEHVNNLDMGNSIGFAENVQGYLTGARRQPNMVYDNISLDEGLRTDELLNINFNARRDFEDFKLFGDVGLNYLKAGIQIKERERENIEVNLSVNPGDYPPGSVCINPDLSDNEDCFNNYNTSLGIARLASFTPRFDRFDHDLATLNAAEYIISSTRIIPENLDPERTGATSLDDNYQVYEDSTAAYLMAEFQVGDDATVIAGARYVETEYASTGWMTLKHDRFTQADGELRDIAIPLGDFYPSGFAEKSYDGIYPGVHLRYEMTDELLVRASLWSSYNRPEFDKANIYAKFSDRIQVCSSDPNLSENEAPCGDNLVDDLGATGDLDAYARQYFSLSPGGNALEVGNSELDAMQAGHFDASVSWYGDDGDFFEVAVFYKDIEGFIVDVQGLNVHRGAMPEPIRQALDQIDVNVNQSATPNRNQNVVGIDPNFIFFDVSTTVNGDKAKVYGLETSYSQYFDNGLFVNGNLTLLDSSADAGETVRADDIPLPNQADVTTNLTLGWENEEYSARVIANFRSEVLRDIGVCSQADLDADAEWARLNDASNSGALAGAAGSGVVYSESCRVWADTYHDDIFSLDFKATYSPERWENVKFYLDVLNITEDVDVFYYTGNEYSRGNVLNFSESIGRTVQAGVNISLW